MGLRCIFFLVLQRTLRYLLYKFLENTSIIERYLDIIVRSKEGRYCPEENGQRVRVCFEYQFRFNWRDMNNLTAWIKIYELSAMDYVTTQSRNLDRLGPYRTYSIIIRYERGGIIGGIV